MNHHLKGHSGTRTLKGSNERKFKCEQCERSFFTRKDVKRHMVVHTGIRNFVCHLCPQRFGRKDHLIRHIKKSHGGKCSSTVDSIKDVTVKVEQGSSTSQGGSMSTSGILCGSSSINSCSVGPTGDTNLSSGIPSQEQISVAQVKQEPFYSAPVEGTFLTSGINPIHIHQEEGNCSILPSCISSVCFSLPTSCNSGMPHFLPNSCFLTTVPGTSNFFPTHSSESVLPLMTSTTIPTFSPPVSLDMGNAALPHFNQAFH